MPAPIDDVDADCVNEPTPRQKDEQMKLIAEQFLASQNLNVDAPQLKPRVVSNSK